MVCYLFVGIAMHRKPDNVTRFLDYSVLVPRAVPGLLAGLAFSVGLFLFSADVARSVAEKRLALGAAGGKTGCVNI
ncbi:Ferric iron ABC transporter [Klebsiella michiganensis]|uniref:Ferric iron ABC transporter n=1 Tax=Klebsiella michiganensis TaxID=1134687 RepID=A0A7H4PLG0_9ENTR|nr:Ferric iron ABC transporter [Klebsiella michiganensis]